MWFIDIDLIGYYNYIRMRGAFMNNVFDNIYTRRSYRCYKPDAVPKDLIEKIVTAGTYAATGMNKQSPIIIAVTNKELRDRLSKLNASIMGRDDGSDPFYGAPVVIIVLAQKDVSTHVYDGSLVLGNMMLAAHECGLGSCWIHRAKEEFELSECKALLNSLGVEGEYEGIGHLIVGYPDGDTPELRPRKYNYVYFVE